MRHKTPKIIGFGSPVVDLVAEVDEAFIASIPGTKGGMELVDSDAMLTLLSMLKNVPVKAAGGSAGNTIFALARMGVDASFLGKLGEDENGVYYREAFEKVGGDCSRFKVDGDRLTACCLSLVTPDSERTMRTDLGVAMHLQPEEITDNDLEGFSLAHVEGYLLFNPDLLMAVLEAAKRRNVSVSLDLGSYEVVDAAREILPGILENYIDIVFANEEEAAHFTGRDDPRDALDALSGYCDITAVKLGKKGSLLKRGDETVEVSSMVVDNAVDTTGAGDYWAAGYLLGHLRGYTLEKSGLLGSLLGGIIVQYYGADVPDGKWNEIIERIDNSFEKGNGALW